MTIDVELRQLSERLAPVGVADIRALRGGMSSITYVGTLDGGDRRVVVKVAPAGLAPVLNRDVLRQARLLRALHATAVPVPEVLWEDAGTPPDMPPLFVMSFVEGTSLEPLFDLDGDEDETLVAERLREAARVMAALHALEPQALGLTGEPLVGPAEEVDRWGRLLETVEASLAPGWEAVARTLRTGQPPSLRCAVVHGDFRLGNTLGMGAGISAVVDWEIWSLGDPRVDVGWFLANADPVTYRRQTRYVDAVPSPAELVDIYNGAVGYDVPDLAWFQALACFKSTATWSLIVKHNRRRATPDPATEEMTAVLPRLLERAQELLRWR